jgi:F0F1-type ATP synthase membrane subunit b/b'
LLRVQAERESRTTGLSAQAGKDLDRYAELLNQYETRVKDARMESYRRQEQVRSEALQKRGVVLEDARKSAEKLVQQSRASVQAQIQQAREQLTREARDIARVIASALLQRPA